MKTIATNCFVITVVTEKDIPNLADVIGGRLWSIDGVAPDGVTVVPAEVFQYRAGELSATATLPDRKINVVRVNEQASGFDKLSLPKAAPSYQHSEDGPGPLITKCPWCGASGPDFDQSERPSYYCHHDPAEIVNHATEQASGSVDLSRVRDTTGNGHATLPTDGNLVDMDAVSRIVEDSFNKKAE